VQLAETRVSPRPVALPGRPAASQPRDASSPTGRRNGSTVRRPARRRAWGAARYHYRGQIHLPPGGRREGRAFGGGGGLASAEAAVIHADQGTGGGGGGGAGGGEGGTGRSQGCVPIRWRAPGRAPYRKSKVAPDHRRPGGLWAPPSGRPRPCEAGRSGAGVGRVFLKVGGWTRPRGPRAPLRPAFGFGYSNRYHYRVAPQ